MVLDQFNRKADFSLELTEKVTMAKAHVTLASGAKVIVEGSDEEVANLVLRLNGGGASERTPDRGKKAASSRKTVGKASLSDLITDLMADGLMKTPIGVSAVMAALEQQGHFYRFQTVSTALLRLVKRRLACPRF